MVIVSLPGTKLQGQLSLVVLVSQVCSILVGHSIYGGSSCRKLSLTRSGISSQFMPQNRSEHSFQWPLSLKSEMEKILASGRIGGCMGRDWIRKTETPGWVGNPARLPKNRPPKAGSILLR